VEEGGRDTERERESLVDGRWGMASSEHSRIAVIQDTADTLGTFFAARDTQGPFCAASAVPLQSAFDEAGRRPGVQNRPPNALKLESLRVRGDSKKIIHVG
jgi:hypothetical protein